MAHDLVDGRAYALRKPVVVERGWVAATLDRLLMHDAINLVSGNANL